MARNWAIAIGINGYDNLRSLHYAKADAEAIKTWCETEAGFDRVFLFTEDSPPIDAKPMPISTKPTYGRLRRFLRAQFDRPLLGPGDNLWFFFAGHGKRYQDRDYLMLSDSDSGDVSGSALSVTWITERLRRCGADNVVLFLDACRSEASRGETGIGLEEPQGVITFYGCDPRMVSYEIEALKQGAFTYALLEALRIKGTNNCATVERLYQRLQYRVPQIVQSYHKPLQRPYAIAEPATKYHLILLPQQATLKDAETLKLDAFREERKGNYQFAEQLWIRVLGVSPADRDAIEAIKYLARLETGINTVNDAREELRDSKLRGETSLSSKLKFEFEVITVNDKGEEIKRETSQAEYFQEDLGNDVILDLVSIPEGTFFRGTDDAEIERLVKKFDRNYFRREKPQREVTVSAFLMGKYPITQKQWRTVVNAVGKIDINLDADPSHFKGDDRPVEQVNWYDCVEFCKRLSKLTGREYQLPSEAQWEYACRATTKTPFHFGATLTTELANYDGNYLFANEPKENNQYREETTAVGQFPANAFGLYDMHGNVWEWCADDFHDNYEGAPIDGSAWTSSDNSATKILRGGSWDAAPYVCRCALRSDINPVNRLDFLGLRVVVVSPRT